MLVNSFYFNRGNPHSSDRATGRTPGGVFLGWMGVFSLNKMLCKQP